MESFKDLLPGRAQGRGNGFITIKMSTRLITALKQSHRPVTLQRPDLVLRFMDPTGLRVGAGVGCEMNLGLRKSEMAICLSDSGGPHHRNVLDTTEKIGVSTGPACSLGSTRAQKK